MRTWDWGEERVAHWRPRPHSSGGGDPDDADWPEVVAPKVGLYKSAWTMQTYCYSIARVVGKRHTIAWFGTFAFSTCIVTTPRGRTARAATSGLPGTRTTRARAVAWTTRSSPPHQRAALPRGGSECLTCISPRPTMTRITFRHGTYTPRRRRWGSFVQLLS